MKDPKAPPQMQELEARALKVKMLSADANLPEDLDDALQTLARARVDVVIVLQTSMLISENARIAHQHWPSGCQPSTDIANMSLPAG